jgi:hypothetical protein
MPGKYTIIGQRSGYQDSEPSDVIEVTAPQAKVYTITISNLCGSTQSDIQVGVAPLAGDVQVWYDILTAGVHTTETTSGISLRYSTATRNYPFPKSLFHQE